MSDNVTVFDVDYTGVAGIKCKGTGNGTLTYIRPQGTKSITQNGTGIDVAQYASVDVSVSGGGGSNLQSKSVSYTPSETAQSETVSPDSGYDGLSSVAVSVGAISSTYVGSGITRRGDSDIEGEYNETYGYDVFIPEGYYSHDAGFNIAKGTEGTPTATKGTVSNHAISVTPSVTNTAGYISGGTKTGTAVSVAASELVSGTLTISSSGTKDVTNYASASVGAGSVNVPTATKGTVSNNTVSVTPSVSFGAGYIEGGSSTGTAVSVSASELVDGTYTINSAGTKDVTNYASASVAAGTEGTPTATKGTVSNHAISVTPSVTNSAGFITGATKTGTAVSVSASELVSGSETKTANGTYNVTNLASLVVAVPIVTYYTSSSNPTSSQGSNGDIWLVTS